jgi:hypothetical protein
MDAYMPVTHEESGSLPARTAIIECEAPEVHGFSNATEVR